MRVLNSLKKLAAAAVLGVAVLGAAGSVEAAPISGAIDITGTVSNPTATTGVTFTSLGDVAYVEGDFADYLAVDDKVSIFSFAFDSLPTTVWMGGGFAFQLLTVVNEAVVNTSGGINFTVRGLLTHVDFEDTYGTFSFSSNSTNGVRGSFSSTTAVPLPAGLLLIGTGVAGLGLMGRRKAKAGKDLVAA